MSQNGLKICFSKSASKMEQKRFFRPKGSNWPSLHMTPGSIFGEKTFFVSFLMLIPKNIFSVHSETFLKKKGKKNFVSEWTENMFFGISIKNNTKKVFSPKIEPGVIWREGQLDPFGRKNLFCSIFDADFEKHIFSPFWDYMIFACVFSKKKVA